MNVFKKILKLAVLGLFLAGLVGCSQALFKADIKDYAANKPALNLEKFFEGRS